MRISNIGISKSKRYRVIDIEIAATRNASFCKGQGIIISKYKFTDSQNVHSQCNCYTNTDQ